MRISQVRVKNWRNFRDIEFSLDRRLFIVGANATGKSNLLDVFRFLKDIAIPGGGLTNAVERRGGLKTIRNLNTRNYNKGQIEIAVKLQDGEDVWSYTLAIIKEQAGLMRPIVVHEIVKHNDITLLERPNTADDRDPELLTQTHLEQIASNSEFRNVAQLFANANYFNPSPQNIRYSERGMRRVSANGDGLIAEMNDTRQRDRDSRLNKIQQALAIAVPEFQSLDLEVDASGQPHLVAGFKHWRAQPAKQRESEFSDGTVRLIALLWAVLSQPKSDGTLLLEEPEISLNREIVKRLPSMLASAQRGKNMQVVMTTHSPDLLDDEGLDPSEVLVLTVGDQYTEARKLSECDREMKLLQAGFSTSDVVSTLINPSIGSEINGFVV